MHNQNNPYSSQGNPWSNNNNDHNRQKRLDDARTKQQYKISAETGLDNIVRDYKNAVQNHIKNWHLDPSDKASVVRYSKRYWDNSFFTGTFFIMLITFVLSFYTSLAVFGIFAVFLLREMFSQQVLLTYLLNDHELTRKQITEIKDKIFFKQLKTSSMAIIAGILMFVSYSSLLISKPIYLIQNMTQDQIQSIVNFLSKFYPFYITHELFAYFNVGSIMVLMLLKLYEKWSR